MSSYSCVLPVDWETFHERVVPAWIDVLGGRRSGRDFYDRFVPLGDPLGDEESLEIDRDRVAPRSLIDHLSRTPWSSLDGDSVRASTEWLQFGRGMESFLLELAIKQSAGIELPGHPS